MNKTEFISFHEYLNSKGKMQEDPDVKLVATFDDEPTNAPEKYDGQKEKPSPYSNPTKKSKFIAEPEDGLGDEGKEMKSSKCKDDSEGLGHEGDKKLIYEPKVSSVSEWTKETRNMKVSQLAKKIKNEGCITPANMHKTIKETVEFCKNTTFASSLVIELKKKNII